MKPGFFAARKLLPNSDRYAAVRFINVSDISQTLSRGSLLGDGGVLSDVSTESATNVVNGRHWK